MRNSTLASPRRHRANSPAPSSFCDNKRSDKDRTRRLDRKQEPPCGYERPFRKRDGLVSPTIDRQDPLRYSPNKRMRSSAVHEEAIPSHKRVPLVEIRRESWSETAYTFGTRDSPTKNDDGRRQHARESPVKSTNIVREDARAYVKAYATTRYRRSKSDLGTWDRLQSTRKRLKQSVQTSSKPLTQPGNSRGSSSVHCAASNGWSNGKDDQYSKEEAKNWGFYDESCFKGTRNMAIISSRGQKMPLLSSSEMRAEGCQRVEAWKLACALAHEYLKKKHAEEKNAGGGSGRGEAWAVKMGFMQICGDDLVSGNAEKQHEQAETETATATVATVTVAAAAAEKAAEEAQDDDDDDAEEEKQSTATAKVEIFQGLCMDGVVNPTQAAAWLGDHHQLNGAFASVETC